MSNHNLESKLDLLINLLETLPQRIMIELEKRPKIRIEAYDPKDQEIADQLEKAYNHVYVGKGEK